MSRTDDFRPSVIDPADFEWLLEADAFSESPGRDQITDAAAMRRWEAAGGQHFEGHWQDRRGCDCCGAHNIRWITGFHHIPTGQMVVLGTSCADNLAAPTRDQLEARRDLRARENARKAEAERVRNIEGISDEGLALISEIADSTNPFLADVFRSATVYGKLSARQVEVAYRVMDEDAEAAATRAAIEAAMPTPAPVPDTTDRIQITGLVLGTKTQDSQFGSQFKALIVDDRGFKVWGTNPSNGWFEKGARVTFVATVEKSDDDDTFGFYSRPTKADILVYADGMTKEELAAQDAAREAADSA